MTEQLLLKKIPFDVGAYNQKIDARIPKHLSFICIYDKKSGRVKQIDNPQIRRALNTAYRVGCYGSTPLGEGTFGQQWADDIFSAIIKATENNDLKDISFLEIGCANGYLCYLLKKRRAKRVLGIEPGDKALVGRRKFKINIIRDFFPSKKVKEKQDFIFSHNVLEHIEDLLDFLENIYNLLNYGGTVFVAVPDCKRKMELGDISILSHEHYNYFTADSLRFILGKVGFSKIKTIPARYNSTIYMYGKKLKKIKEKNVVKINNRKSASLFSKFKKVLHKNIKVLQGIIDENKDKKIGFYGCTSPLFGVLKFYQRFRLFDGDREKHGKYYSGLNGKIENPENLLKSPVDILFITPIDHEKTIRKYLKKIGVSKKIRIVSLKDIYYLNSKNI